MKRLFFFLMALLMVGVGAPGQVGSEPVTLQWDSNTESDLAGYKVYYGPNTGVYDGTLATIDGIEQHSPIDVGLVTEVTVDLPSGGWFFVVTAYDNEVPSLESGYSNEVFKRLSNGPPAAPTGLVEMVIAAIKNFFRWFVGVT